MLRPGRGGTGLPPAGGRHRLGRAGHRGPRSRGCDGCATITISAEQQRLAERRVAAAGLAGRVSVELRDYREASTARFDADLLGRDARGGRRALLGRPTSPPCDRHARPGRPDRAADRSPCRTTGCWPTRRTYTWIQKYIFPGGLLPSVTAIENSLAAATRCGSPRARTSAPTTRRRSGSGGSGSARAPTSVACLGFDEVFNRMWTFYLCYSEAGFRAGYIYVSQLTLARTPL